MCVTTHTDICSCHSHGGFGAPVFSKKKKIEMLEKYLNCLNEKKKDI